MSVVVSMTEKDKDFALKAMHHYLECPIAFDKEMKRITRQKAFDKINRSIKRDIIHHFKCISILLKGDEELKKWFKEKYREELK